jgi:class 3 adenylate cyclase
MNLPMAQDLSATGITLAELKADASIHPAGILLIREYGPIFAFFESVAFIAAFEWMRRVLLTVTTPLKWRPLQCLRVAQGLIALNMVLSVLRPVSRVEVFLAAINGLEHSLWTLTLFMLPMLLALILSFVAIAALITQQPDSNETVRLRSLAFATPFLMSGMFISLTIEAVLLTVIVEIILLYGIFRYQALRGQRDQFVSRFLSPQVRQLVQEHGLSQAMRREQRNISILFCDLRNFTAYSDKHSAEEVVSLLEGFYGVMGEAAASHGGTVKDHAGDGVLVLVGAPVEVEDGPRQAVEMALAMQQAMTRLAKSRGPSNATLGLGIGIASGPVVVGAIEAASRLEYVAVGDSVNRAARLCSKAEGGIICIDSQTRDSLPTGLKDRTSAQGEMQLKGFADPVALWAVTPDAGN